MLMLMVVVMVMFVVVVVVVVVAGEFSARTGERDPHRYGAIYQEEEDDDDDDGDSTRFTDAVAGCRCTQGQA